MQSLRIPLLSVSDSSLIVSDTTREQVGIRPSVSQVTYLQLNALHR